TRCSRPSSNPSFGSSRPAAAGRRTWPKRKGKEREKRARVFHASVVAQRTPGAESPRNRGPAMTSLGQALVDTITSPDPRIRDRSVRHLTEGASTAEVLAACGDLEAFRQRSENLYERVRASMFLHTIYRFDIQDDPAIRDTGLIPFDGFRDL